MSASIWSRRAFLRAAGAAMPAALTLKTDSVEQVLSASQSVADRAPEEVAKDAFFWREVQLAFKLDRTLINLNNGFTCPTHGSRSNRSGATWI